MVIELLSVICSIWTWVFLTLRHTLDHCNIFTFYFKIVCCILLIRGSLGLIKQRGKKDRDWKILSILYTSTSIFTGCRWQQVFCPVWVILPHLTWLFGKLCFLFQIIKLKSLIRVTGSLKGRDCIFQKCSLLGKMDTHKWIYIIFTAFYDYCTISIKIAILISIKYGEILVKG